MLNDIFKAEIEVNGEKIKTIPIEQPRKGWDEKFKEMHESGDDKLIFDENLEEW